MSSTQGHCRVRARHAAVSAATAPSCPLPTLLWASVSPGVQSGAQGPSLSGSRTGASVDSTPHVDSWAQGRLAGVLARARWGALPTCQVTGCRPALCTPGGEHTRIDTAPRPAGGGRGGGQAEEVGLGRPSLNQPGTKAAAGRLPSPRGQRPGGRMNHQALSTGFVPAAGEGRRAGLNSAALSRSGRAADYHTAGLVNWAGLGSRSGGRGAATAPQSWGLSPQATTPPHPRPCDWRAGRLL